MIFSHLESSPHDLTKILRVCKHFYLAGIETLWEHAEPRDLMHGSISDTIRREKLASFVKHVQFSPYEVMWLSETYPCPQFKKSSSLELYGSSLTMNEPEMLQPFLSSNLRDLRIFTGPNDTGDLAHTRRDHVWLSHLGLRCANLTTLTLEVTLNVSSAQMAAFFVANPRLEELRLGHQLSSVLDSDGVSEILMLHRLKQLSMDLPLGSSNLDDFMAATSPGAILPQLRKIELVISENESLSTMMLLSSLRNLQEVTVSFTPTTRDEVVVPHPGFLQAITTLPELRALTLYLSSPAQFTVDALSAVASKESLVDFNILALDRHYLPKPARLSITAEDITKAPMNFKFLQTLDLVEIESPIIASYDEEVQITQMVNNVSASYMCLFDLSVDEAASGGWPSVSDYEAVMDHTAPPDSIWKASLKSFSPDPVGWVPRDLKVHLTKDGKVVSVNELVTDGQYNYIV